MKSFGKKQKLLISVGIAWSLMFVGPGLIFF